ncbi:threonine/serine exporter family protein [Salsuginibacillus kocurii]|uniref:threonine/serine exporter family protein n=1 Tax=Salsuginibacillus kocurii TaxID=427078 RepID=UPI00037B670E|nr:threonine/serine exporter family protein [Salsuginibacillus kocurii]
MGKTEKAIEVCLFAGKLMIKYGAETYRVEDTMQRMGEAAGMKNVHTFVTTTGIFFSCQTEQEEDLMQMIRVDQRFQDLNKVTEVNQVSREFVWGDVSLVDAKKRLIEISEAPMNYPIWFIYLASGVAGAAFSYLMGGSVVDMGPAFIGGLITILSLVFLQRYIQGKFFSEFLAAFLGGVTALLLVHIGIGTNIDQVIIGSMIPLVPGIPITNSVRDLMSGDLVAGVSRGAEAAITSLSIAAGVALALSLFLT